jgi:hypothetical protein
MKKLLTTIFILVSLFAHAQVDSSKINITLSARRHAFIVAFMPDRGGVDQVKYMTQLATKIVLDDSGHVVDTAQLITVTVTTDLVKRLFLNIGSQQERLTTMLNDEIKSALFPQLFARPQLLQDIIDITNQNTKERNELIEYGFHFITEIKLY